jgi:hypothetical protein
MARVIQPEVDCSTAEDFLEALSPLGPYFRKISFTEPWLFRGQGQDDPLIPSAFRTGEKKDRLAKLTNRDLSDFQQRLLAERDVLIQFFNIADRRGLILPDDSQELRSKLETLSSEWGDAPAADWGERLERATVALSLTALAQHYGIPTRLLDWTRQSLIAAFFAAEDASKHTDYKPSSRLVVWAFHFPLLGRHAALHQQTAPVRIVTAPTATNPNLKAQQGIFTLQHPHNTKEAQGDYLSLEQMLEDMAKDVGPAHSDANKLIVGCELRKFTLPVSESGALLTLLAKLDITPSSIYPGYHSIVRDIEMEKKLAVQFNE